MRKLIILLIILIPQIYVFSQNTSKITFEQIKTANLIFNEHQNLKLLVPLLEKKINNLQIINSSWKKQDSISRLQVNMYNDLLQKQYLQIQDLNKSIRLRNKVIKYGTAGSVILIVLCLLRK